MKVRRFFLGLLLLAIVFAAYPGTENIVPQAISAQGLPGKFSATQMTEIPLSDPVQHDLWTWSTSGGMIALYDYTDKVTIYDADSGSKLASFDLARVNSMTFSMDDQRFAVGTTEGKFYVFNTADLLAREMIIAEEFEQALIADQVPQFKISEFDAHAATLAFSMDSAWLIAQWEYKFAVWNVNSATTTTDIEPTVVHLGPVMNDNTLVQTARTFEYEGEIYEVYQVPFENAIHEWALVNRGRRSSTFVDPADIEAGVFEVEVNVRELEPVWEVVPGDNVYELPWDEPYVLAMRSIGNQFVLVVRDHRAFVGTLYITPGQPDMYAVESTPLLRFEAPYVDFNGNLSHALSVNQETELVIQTWPSGELRTIDRSMTRGFAAAIHPSEPTIALWDIVESDIGRTSALYLTPWAEEEHTSPSLVIPALMDMPSMQFSSDGTQLAVIDTYQMVLLTIEEAQPMNTWAHIARASDQPSGYAYTVSFNYPAHLLPAFETNDDDVPVSLELTTTELANPDINPWELDSIPPDEYRVMIQILNNTVEENASPSTLDEAATLVSTLIAAENVEIIVASTTIADRSAATLLASSASVDILFTIVEVGNIEGEQVYILVALATEAGTAGDFEHVAKGIVGTMTLNFSPDAGAQK